MNKSTSPLSTQNEHASTRATLDRSIAKLTTLRTIELEKFLWAEKTSIANGTRIHEDLRHKLQSMYRVALAHQAEPQPMSMDSLPALETFVSISSQKRPHRFHTLEISTDYHPLPHFEKESERMLESPEVDKENSWEHKKSTR